MTLAVKGTVVTKAIQTLLEQEKDALGVRKVFYGEQSLYPEFPAIAVQSGRKLRSHENTRKNRLDFSVNILIVHGKVQSSELNREASEVLAEAVEDIVNADVSLGGLVIFGQVVAVDPGVLARRDVMLSTTRLSWEGRSRETF